MSTRLKSSDPVITLERCKILKVFPESSGNTEGEGSAYTLTKISKSKSEKKRVTTASIIETVIPCYRCCFMDPIKDAGCKPVECIAMEDYVQQIMSDDSLILDH